MIELYLQRLVNVCKQHGPSLQLVVYTVHDLYCRHVYRSLKHFELNRIYAVLLFVVFRDQYPKNTPRTQISIDFCHCDRDVDIKLSVDIAFLEQSSSCMLKINRLESQITYVSGCKKTKEPMHNSQSRFLCFMDYFLLLNERKILSQTTNISAILNEVVGSNATYHEVHSDSIHFR